MTARLDSLWERVSEFVDQAPCVEALKLHGLELIAVHELRAQGREVPAALLELERDAAMVAMAAPAVLAQIRAAYDGTVVLMKGPEAASYFPDPAVRPFRDLDLLVDDPAAAQAALVAHGFAELEHGERVEGVHHLSPLVWPGLPLAVEVHHAPNHAAWLEPLPTAELLELTEPSATGFPGILAPMAPAHALLLAEHGWAHQPLRRLLDLLDVAVTLADHDRPQALALARRWGRERLWKTTVRAVDALLHGEGWALPLELCGRHLTALRERTVLETHLARWMGPAYGLPRKRALRVAAATFVDAARPRGEECWPDAGRRTALALSNAFVSQSRHDRLRELMSAER